MNRNSIVDFLLFPSLKQSLRIDIRLPVPSELDNVSTPLVQNAPLRKYRPANRSLQ